MEETINIQEMLYFLKKRIGLIFGVTFVMLLLGAIVTFFIMTPQYEASTQVLVNQSQNNEEPITSNELESNREIINTYSVIMSSPAILEPVIEELNLNMSSGELSNKITVSAEEESQVANVTVQDTDPEKAVTLANTISRTFEQQIPDIMNVDNVSILSNAEISDNVDPVSPQPIINLGLSLVLGVLLGVCLAFLLEFLDKSIKTEQDIEKQLKLPILGTVPAMNENEMQNHSNNLNSKTTMRSKTRGESRKTS